MNRWLKRFRGTIGMGLTWAVAWGITGILIGMASKLLPGLPWDAFFKIFDAPLPALALPGFFGGILFSGVIGVASRRRRLDELSVRTFAAFGAIGGVLLSLVPVTMVRLGLATLRPGLGVWQFTAMIGGPLTVLCTLSATGALMLAKAGMAPDLDHGAEDRAVQSP